LPIYEYLCDCGLRFERLLPRDAQPPACPACGGATRKIPAGASLGGRASDRPRAGGGAPQLQGLRQGGPERVQREVEFRQRLVEKHAETAGGGTRAAAGGDNRPDGGAGAPPAPSGD
jgi:putative FmdB family regulatory protein